MTDITLEQLRELIKKRPFVAIGNKYLSFYQKYPHDSRSGFLLCVQKYSKSSGLLDFRDWYREEEASGILQIEILDNLYIYPQVKKYYAKELEEMAQEKNVNESLSEKKCWRCDQFIAYGDLAPVVFPSDPPKFACNACWMGKEKKPKEISKIKKYRRKQNEVVDVFEYSGIDDFPALHEFLEGTTASGVGVKKSGQLYFSTHIEFFNMVMPGYLVIKDSNGNCFSTSKEEFEEIEE